MPEAPSFSQEALDAYADKLEAWASRLDPIGLAMLTDLLAKAGGDVHGNVHTGAAASPEGSSLDGSSLSTITVGDFRYAVLGIFTAEQP